MQNNSDVLVGGRIKMVNNGQHFRHDKNAKRKRRMAIHEAVHRQFFDQVQSNLEKKQETGENFLENFPLTEFLCQYNFHKIYEIQISTVSINFNFPQNLW